MVMHKESRCKSDYKREWSCLASLFCRKFLFGNFRGARLEQNNENLLREIRPSITSLGAIHMCLTPDSYLWHTFYFSHLNLAGKNYGHVPHVMIQGDAV